MGFVYMLILEEFCKNNRIENPRIAEIPEDEQFKLDYLRKLLKDAEITRPEHVDYYLDYHVTVKHDTEKDIAAVRFLPTAAR